MGRFTALLAVATVGLAPACTTTYQMGPVTAAAPPSTVARRESSGQGVTVLHGSIAGRPRHEPALIPAPAFASGGDGPVLLAPPDIIGYEVKQRGRGAAEGLGLGVLTGALLGGMAGAALGSDPDNCVNHDHCSGFTITAGDKAAIGATLGGLTGALVGLVVGAAVGHTDRILF
jgi:hypothetical protein